MSFTDWLLDQRHRDDPVGDLARDVAMDDDWPESDELEECSDYLMGKRAAQAALHRAWSEYMRS